MTNIWFLSGRRAVPNRTAVPDGDVLISFLETTPLTTGNIDRNPVLFFVGSPFTVAKSIVESLLKNTWDTVFSGPDGGVVWFSWNGRRAVSSGSSPLEGQMEKQDIPATAPELATHACWSVEEMLTLTGNSPSVLAG